VSTTAVPHAPTRPSRPGGPVRLPARAHAVTLLASLWLIVGLFVDGWAHNTRPSLESFFTPWHAVFYSGFAATAGWIAWQVLRAQEAGHRGRDAVPAGYGLGLVGLAIFAVGGASDMAWHTVLGVEQDIEALFSPTHLVLLLGMALIVTSPLRAAWAERIGRDPGGLVRFLPPLLAAALCTALVQFFFMYLFEPGNSTVSISPAGPDGQAFLISGIAGLLITNVIVVTPLLYLLRRWDLPFGSATVLFSVVGVLLAALDGFASLTGMAVMAAAGLAADVLLRVVRPSPERPAAFRTAAVGVPVVLWSVHFLVAGLLGPIVWAPELWSGLIVYAGLTGLALAQLLLPSPVPAPPAAAGTADAAL